MKRPFSLALDVDTINQAYKKQLSEKENASIDELINTRITNKTVHKLATYIDRTLLVKDINDSKKEYDNIINNYEYIGTHGPRQFDIMEPNNPYYMSSVYINDKNVVKIFNYNCSNAAEFMIIKEMAYQMYASDLSDKCKFKVPLIKSYGKFNVKDNSKYRYSCIFYIVMEKINFFKLNDALMKLNIDNNDKLLCNKIATRLTELNTCLGNNDLHHNDYHKENIMINVLPNNDIDIALIDYGNADSIMSEKIWEYTCDKLIKIKEKEESLTSLSNSSAFSKSGGKRRKTSKKRTKPTNKFHKKSKKYTFYKISNKKYKLCK